MNLKTLRMLVICIILGAFTIAICSALTGLATLAFTTIPLALTLTKVAIYGLTVFVIFILISWFILYWWSEATWDSMQKWWKRKRAKR